MITKEQRKEMLMKNDKERLIDMLFSEEEGHAKTIKLYSHLQKTVRGLVSDIMHVVNQHYNDPDPYIPKDGD